MSKGKNVGYHMQSEIMFCRVNVSTSHKIPTYLNNYISIKMTLLICLSVLLDICIHYTVYCKVEYIFLKIIDKRDTSSYFLSPDDGLYIRILSWVPYLKMTYSISAQLRKINFNNDTETK